VLTQINDLSEDKVHLIMAGDGDIHWADRLDKFVVHKTGYIRDMRTMAQYLAASDVFLYPTRADNLPNVLVEAIAAGTPCVTVAVGGCPEIIRDGKNGRVLVPGDLTGMAHAAVAMLRDDTTRATLSTNCRAIAQQEFSLQGMGQQYIDLFHRVAK
jgi:glycosyltransferase involved in cell wall biosynthesis